MLMVWGAGGDLTVPERLRGAGSGTIRAPMGAS